MLHSHTSPLILFLLPLLVNSLPSCAYTKHDITSSSAVCLDGSKPSYFIRQRKALPSNKWHVFFEGAGWCFTSDSCRKRSQTSLGSSHSHKCVGVYEGYLSPSAEKNPVLHDFNYVHVRSCDGGSWSGNTSSQLDDEGTTLHYRGYSIRRALISQLLEIHGMDKAVEVVISGQSAGGLAVILGIDDMASQIYNVNNRAKVVGLVDSGFFPDINFSENVMYGHSMRSIFSRMNMLSGSNAECLKHHISSPSDCIFAQHVLPYVRTPLFMIQSSVDAWLLKNVVPRSSVSADSIRAFSDAITRNVTIAIKPLLYSTVFVTHCRRHGFHMQFDSVSTVDGLTISAAFSHWYGDVLNGSTGRKSYIQSGSYPCPECCLSSKLLDVKYLPRNRSLLLGSPRRLSTYDKNVPLVCENKRHYLVASHARCIDGSLPAFYIRHASQASPNKWHIFFEGGGWCTGRVMCNARSSTPRGSSKTYHACMSCSFQAHVAGYLSCNKEDNPSMYDYNTVYIRYCDGGSFAGHAEEKFNGKTLHYRGHSIRRALISQLLEIHGMDKAVEVVISGQSAGGLAVMLGIDDMASQIYNVNNRAKVVGLVDSGFFPDIDFSVDRIGNRTYRYSSSLRSTFHNMRMFHGTNRYCLQDKEVTTADCAFAEYLIPHVGVPLFIMQSSYDSWVLRNVVPWRYIVNRTLQSTVARISDGVVQGISNHVLSSAFIDECFHHGYKRDLYVAIQSDTNYTTSEAFAEWHRAVIATDVNRTMKLSKVFRTPPNYACPVRSESFEI